MLDPSIADLTKQVADLKAGAADLTTAANIVWTLVTGFLVRAHARWCSSAGGREDPRALGKYDKYGNAQPIPVHDMPMALLGTFILAFGWFGFNPEMGVLAFPDDAIPPGECSNARLRGRRWRGRQCVPGLARE